MKIWFELSSQCDEGPRQPFSPVALRVCFEFGMGAVFVHLVRGFKQLFGGLDDHELFKGLHLILPVKNKSVGALKSGTLHGVSAMLEGFGIEG